MNTLIIAEKPSVALRIASAIGGGKQIQKRTKEKVSYYEISGNGSKIYVVAAVGHLFTIRQKGKSSEYPVLEVEWAPSYAVGKHSGYTKKYLDGIVSMAKECGAFINACDYDIEGTVIGTNIIKFITNNRMEHSKRMKFSTTTTKDLVDAYSAIGPLDMDNFYAGEARHMLDWLWGINLSRALTRALVGRSFSRSLSIGRVQGPTLAILAKHEESIEKFVPKPFWRLTAVINGTEFSSTRGDIFDKEMALQVHQRTKSHASSARIDSVESVERKANPYPPFDLTSLQMESSRALRMDPSRTLSVAQSLYERAYISYPRTSSQKLPASLGLRRIISDIAKNPDYERLAGKLIAANRYAPAEGAKTDEAHPAIFPTGMVPAQLTREEQMLYDMITKRFLACFAEPAIVARMRVVADFGGEKYSANGAKMVKKGWLEFYEYTKLEERELPYFVKGAAAAASRVDIKEMQTQPPKRYSKATLLSELEKRDLGTKATRAAIIDTLFKRNYIEGSSIKVTKFGMVVYRALEKNCKMIVDEATTRRLEENMESISRGKKSESEAVEEGKQMLMEAIKTFDEHKDQIAEAMRKGLYESEVLGKCPKDGGDLVIKRSRAGKYFVACNNYPKCTNTYSLPQGAAILPTGRTCEHCHTPIIKVLRKGRRPFEMDLDPNCITKKEWQPFAEIKQKVEKPDRPAEAANPAKEKKVKATRKAAKKKTRKIKVQKDEGI
ncbi:MAG: DNA topoisomerase I [Candidatus Marsarchaeota archaeon]|nr:DNA topoisomerase I [Candidatus Marsarchaeota archaeon]